MRITMGLRRISIVQYAFITDVMQYIMTVYGVTRVLYVWYLYCIDRVVYYNMRIHR